MLRTLFYNLFPLRCNDDRKNTGEHNDVPEHIVRVWGNSCIRQSWHADDNGGNSEVSGRQAISGSFSCAGICRRLGEIRLTCKAPGFAAFKQVVLVDVAGMAHDTSGQAGAFIVGDAHITQWFRAGIGHCIRVHDRAAGSGKKKYIRNFYHMDQWRYNRRADDNGGTGNINCTYAICPASSDNSIGMGYRERRGTAMDPCLVQI